MERTSSSEVRSCVWYESPGQVWSLRFHLSDRCRETQCEFAPNWDLYRQVTSVKVAQLLGVPLSEVQSGFLYWRLEDAGTPELSKFRVTRRGEDDFPGRRLASGEPVYELHLTFRIDSARISRSSRGVDLLFQNDTGLMSQVLGMPAHVHDLDFNRLAATAPASGANRGEFQTVYQFDGSEVNDIPLSGLEIGGISAGLAASARGCLDKCYIVNEAASVLGPSRCVDDCDCNGARWCGHLGECVGQNPPCRSEGHYTTTTTTVSMESTVTVTVTTTTALPTAFARPHIPGIVGRCEERAADTWMHCGNASVTGTGEFSETCRTAACGLVGVVADTVECQGSICSEDSSGPTSMGYWRDVCSSSEVRAAFDGERSGRCEQRTTTAEIVVSAQDVSGEVEEKSVLDPFGGGAIGPLFWIFVLAVVLGILAFLLKALCKLIPRLVERVMRSVYSCLGREYKSDARRASYARRRNSTSRSRVWDIPQPRNASNLGAKPATSKWSQMVNVILVLPRRFRRSSGHEGPGPSVVPDEEQGRAKRSDWTRSTPPEGSPRSASDSAASSASTASGPNNKKADDSTRSSWWSQHEHRGGSSSSSSQGPRAAAYAAGDGPSDGTSTLEAEALIIEMRRLREKSIAERKRYFQKQLLKWHPDKNIGNEERASNMFRVLQQNKGWFLDDQ